MTVARPSSHRFISQRLNLHYVDWGNEDAPPLVLVHGGRDHCRSWDWIAQELRNDFHIIAPDLRGHGDSDWSPEGNYASPFFIYDLAQLVHHLKLAPVRIVAHSLGGNIAIRYAGLYPKNVTRLVAIEGLGPSPKMQAEFDKIGLAQRVRDWIENRRAASARTRRKYATFDEALARMKDENTFLSDEQARHLTAHGAVRNEDGTWSWKFDDYLRIFPAYDFPVADDHALWAAIECPTLLVYGEKSWASNPVADGRAAHFRNAEVKLFPDAGHWVHHDRFDAFLQELRRFL